MEARLLKGEELVLPESSLIEDMVASCRKFSDSICMIETDSSSSTKKEITYRDFFEKAVSVSRTLRSLGQTPGKVVAIVSDTDIETMSTLFGVWISGAASTAMIPALPVAEIQKFLKIIKCEVAFCSPDYLPKVREAAKDLDPAVVFFTIGEDGRKPLDSSNNLQEDILYEPLSTGRDHSLAVMFTSGTTGVPKGVLIRDGALKFNTVLSFFGERTRLLLTTPIYWVTNVIFFSVAICKGNTVLLGCQASPQQLLEIITTYKPTEWLSQPATYLSLCQVADLQDFDTSSLKLVSVGGSQLLAEQRVEICRKLFGGKSILRAIFGSTEAVAVTYDPSPPELTSRKMASIGKAAEGVTIKIVDPETGKLQPPYKVGEIRVKSPGVLKKYLNHTMTEQEMDKDGFFNMGDLGYYDEEEYIYYATRAKDVMKYRGCQIAPAELEEVIGSHPDVFESCVVAKPCLQNGDLPTAFVVRKSGSKLTEEQLYNFVSERVIDQKKLRGGIYFQDSLPRNSVGKVLRNELKKQIV